MFRKQLQTFQGGIQPPPPSSTTHFFCARSDCLKIKQTISSTTSVHHLPFNTASYPTKLGSPTILLPEPQMSQQKYLALIFMFSEQELITVKSSGPDTVQSCRCILTFQTCCLILQHQRWRQ